MMVTVSVAAVSLISPLMVSAADSGATPVVVPKDRDDRDLLRDLRGAPDNVKDLILNFDKLADKYLMKQRMLLIEYKNATSPEQRAAIREQLQDNRQTFLTELKGFREQLHDDLAALKGKISQAELRRILDAARDAAGRGDRRHKGQK
jgi:hypothetical protein